jgi:hypothetical protein
MPRITIDRLNVTVPRGSDTAAIARAVAKAVASEAHIAEAAGTRVSETSEAVGRQVESRLRAPLRGRTP